MQVMVKLGTIQRVPHKPFEGEKPEASAWAKGQW